MATVSARRTLAGASITEAEALWYALERRPTFVDGFARPDLLHGDWPQVGSRVVWSSPAGGRGRVVENVTDYEPGASQAVAVEDGDLRGTQTVRFERHGADCVIALELSYRVKREGIAGALADAVYLRRRQRASLERTLARFAIELAAERELHS
ncbi:MAG: SRPBCC family protein [Solirubrobacteraceae bacterium]